MSTSTGTEPIAATGVESRVLREGYGPGAWHGPDFKAALDGVTPALALWRPAAGRHNIAEIALHHAYYVHVVRTKLSARPAEPFVVAGDDWFDVNDERARSWATIRSTVESEQRQLAELISALESGAESSPLAGPERFDLVLGITCHANYHAGQVQLIRRLHGG